MPWNWPCRQPNLYNGKEKWYHETIDYTRLSWGKINE